MEKGISTIGPGLFAILRRVKFVFPPTVQVFPQRRRRVAGGREGDRRRWRIKFSNEGFAVKFRLWVDDDSRQLVKFERLEEETREDVCVNIPYFQVGRKGEERG